MSLLKLIDRTAICYLVGGLLSIVLSIIAVTDFLSCDFVTYRLSRDWTSDAGYTTSQFVSLVISVITLPLGIVLLLIFAIQSSKNKWNIYGKLVTYFVVTCFCAVGISRSYNYSREVLSCGVFCLWTVEVGRNDTNNAAVIAVALIYTFVFAFLFLVFVYLLMIANFALDETENFDYDSIYYQSDGLSPRDFEEDTYNESEDRPLMNARARPSLNSSSTNSRANNEPNGNTTSATPIETAFATLARKRKQSVLSLALVFAVLLPIVVLAATLLPTWWSSFSLYDIQHYQSSVPLNKYGPYWMLALSDDIYSKLYPDIAIFYGMIYIVSAVAIAAQSIDSIRIKLLSKPNYLCGYCVGEVLLIISFVTLMLGEFCYWYYVHGWEDSSVSSRTAAERAARSIGQLSNAAVGSLVLPIARNSVWSYVFGMSYEAMIRFHTCLGYFVLTLVCAHALCWWIVFAQNDSFPHDIFAIPTVYHADNFTIPLAVLTAVGMLMVMGLLAHHTVRRANYDLFYYTHHFFLVVFLVMLWHATMAWYYLLGGLVLWAVDHCIRLQQSLSNNVSNVALEVVGSGNIVKLSYTVSKSQDIFKGLNPFLSASKGSFRYEMGQFCLVNIPEISQLAWHPFTISSIPSDSLVTHHIKSMGSDQWTARLLQLAKRVQQVQGQSVAGRNSSSNGISGSNNLYHTTLPNEGNDAHQLQQLMKTLVVNIDGPYGMPIDTAKYRSILLIAGGIGITPLHAAYKHMFYSNYVNTVDRWAYQHIKQIKLIWILRESQDISIFEESLHSMSRMFLQEQDGRFGSEDSSRAHGPQFSVAVYVTGDHDSHISNMYYTDAIEDRFGYEYEKQFMKSQLLESSYPTISNTPTIIGDFDGINDDSDGLINRTVLRSNNNSNNNNNSTTTVSTATNVHLYPSSSTSSSHHQGGSYGPGKVKFKSGRPDLDSEVNALAGLGAEAMVCCCGPQSLSTTVQRLCQRYAVHFKQDTFEL